MEVEFIIFVDGTKVEGEWKRDILISSTTACHRLLACQDSFRYFVQNAHEHNFIEKRTATRLLDEFKYRSS